MKFGVVPTNLLERLALMTGRIPVPVLDVLAGPLKARAVMAAERLGVFEALGNGARSVTEVATVCHLDPAALEMLLRCLVVFDYVVHAGRGGEPDGTRFALSPMARRTMLRDAPQSLVGYLQFNEVQWRFVAQLEALLRTGQGIEFHDTMTDPDQWQAYQRAMLECARFDAPVLASRVPVPPGARDLLDLAGSHGLIGAAVCRRHPPMRSTVIDLPQALPHARALARAEGLDDVVTHQEGDLLTSELGRHRDVVLLSQILHHFTPNAIATILARIRMALRVGGTIAIWDIEAPSAGTRATAGDIPALYFKLTSTGGAFHGNDYATWLREAGFERVRIARPVTSPGNVLVTGRNEADAEKR